MITSAQACTPEVARRFTLSRVKRALIVSLAGVVPAAAATIDLGLFSDHSNISAVLRFGLAAIVGGVLSLAALALAWWVAWGTQPNKAVLVAAVVMSVVLEAVLYEIEPFRFGLISLALFALMPIGLSVVAAWRSPRGVVLSAGLLIGVFAVAVLVEPLQQRLGAEQWVRNEKISSRETVQVVKLPSLVQMASRWDGKSLVTPFGGLSGPGDINTDAVETVTAGYVDPCGPMLYATGNGTVTASPPCEPEATGLWYRGTSQGAPGYVLQRNGVTIALTGGGTGYVPENESGWLDLTVPQRLGGRDGLRGIIENARPATDKDLQPKGVWMPSSLSGWVLL